MSLKVWSVSLAAHDGQEALGKALNWGTVAWLVLAHDREAAAAIAQGHVEGLHPDWPQDEVAAGLRVEPEPWGDTADLARPRVLVAWVE